MSLLELHDLHTAFHTRAGVVQAVNGVHLRVERGETVALVGESGSGKSVTAYSILRLLAKPAGRITRGRVLFQGTDLASLPERAIRAIRGNRIAMIFQEPLAALNPVISIGRQITEAIRLHRDMGQRAAWERAIELLDRVQISSPRQRAHAYPHQLSGGMRQRAMIAIALACEPDLLIADEPTTALDVTTQAQILALLKELQQASGMGLLLITHDLGVVAEVADRAAVMYAGRVVEEGDVRSLFANPTHPYTQGLLASLQVDRLQVGQRLPEIAGTVPSLLNLPSGCAFAPRCGQAGQRCWSEAPRLQGMDKAQRVACFSPLAQPTVWNLAA